VGNTVSGKAMSNKAVSSKSVSNKAVSSMDKRSSMGNSMVGNRVGNSVVGNGVGNSVDKRSGVGNSVVGNRDSLRVGSSARVGDLGDVTIDVVGVVGHSLDTAVRKVDRVGSLNNTSAIIALGLAEGSARVLVSNSIVVGVGGDLSKVGGSIANSVVSNRGSMDNRGMVNNRGMVDHRGGMDQGCGMGNSMAKTMSDTSFEVLSRHPKIKIKLVFLFNFSDLPYASIREGIFFLRTALEMFNNGGLVESFRKGFIIFSISAVSVVE
jgi:hypothetical protein